jgi:DNA-binding FrmR family transcriptional regulator
MRDRARLDLLKRLACVRGHVRATTQMIERGEDDLAVVHQLQAVCGALRQIRIRLWRMHILDWPDSSEREQHIARVVKEMSEVYRAKWTPHSRPGRERR